MEPIILNGKYNDAKIFAKTIENELITQCMNLLNQEFTKDLKIRIMPDCHAGKGCMIGTTMEIKDKICPNLIGVDISCSMLCVNLGKVNIDFEKFDDVVTKFVPLGAERHTKISKESENFFNKKENQTKAIINLEAPKLQIGTLGGGNHFIELDKYEETGEIYLIIHTGSRNFGKQIAEFWQNKAEGESVEDKLIDTNKLIADLKKENRLLEINDKLKEAKEINTKILKEAKNKELATISGENLENYLYDCNIADRFATLNRRTIANNILKNYFNKSIDEFEHFETKHNYINVEEKMLRKGAISAKKDEIVLIPLNMRDGSLIAKGLGNPEWNNSAPHGAGRIMSRRKAKELIDLNAFKESMEGIYSSSINESTVDESPFAYKNCNEIIDCLKDTVEIIRHIKPIYNKKA